MLIFYCVMLIVYKLFGDYSYTTCSQCYYYGSFEVQGTRDKSLTCGTYSAMPSNGLQSQCPWDPTAVIATETCTLYCTLSEYYRYTVH